MSQARRPKAKNRKAKKPHIPNDDQCEIYTGETVDLIPKGAIENLSPPQLEYITSIIRNGVNHYIDNISSGVEYALIRHKDCALPFTVVEGPQAAFSVSATICWLSYPLHLEEKDFGRGTAPWIASIFRFLERRVRWEKLIILNNWFFTNNPTPVFSPEDLAAFLKTLKSRYPGYMIIVKSIPKADPTNIIPSLRANGFELIAWRWCHYWSPFGKVRSIADRKFDLLQSLNAFADRRASGLKLKNVRWRHFQPPIVCAPSPYPKNFRRDLKVYQKSKLRRGYLRRISDTQAFDMRRLYKNLYMQKHTPMNVDLNENWFLVACNSGFIQFFVVGEPNDIKAFMEIYDDRLGINTAYCGYDLSGRDEFGLYRIIIMSSLQKGIETNKLVNLSTGVADFKTLRGTELAIEYEAIFASHLKLSTRILMRIFVLFHNTLAHRIRPR